MATHQCEDVIRRLEECNLLGAENLVLDPTNVVLESLMADTPAGLADLWYGKFRGNRVRARSTVHCQWRAVTNTHSFDQVAVKRFLPSNNVENENLRREVR